MASTRNLNMRAEYALEQNINDNSNKYNINKYGRSYRDANPTQNVNHGSMARDALSSNPVDIETQLFGIGSTNLVNPKTPVRPGLKVLPEVHFTDKHDLVMPESYIVMNNQRPMRQ